MNHEQNFQQEYNRNRKSAMTFAGSVYTGGVFAATIIFLSFVLMAFPDTAFFIRFLMVIAGLAVGASGLAFPYALHNWAIGGKHRLATMILYYGEIFILILNTIVSFSALLFKFAGNVLPDWVAWYEPFTIFSLGYVIFSWGTIFIMDPQSQARNKEKEAIDRIVTSTAEAMNQYINSQAGRAAIQSRANSKLDQIFNTVSQNPFDHLGSACPHCNTPNPPGTRFCGSCGASQPVPGQAPTAFPAPVSPAGAPPPVQTGNIPALPPRGSAPSNHPRKRYTLDELLRGMNLSPVQARDLIANFGLNDALSAYRALYANGYLPPEYGDPAVDPVSLNEFMYLYAELMGVSPTWNPVSIAPSGGRSF